MTTATSTDEQAGGNTAGSDETPVLEATGLVKLFGRVVGLRGVDLRLFPGEVLAVIGDNGAGKSTLIKCLSGAMAPDQGTIKMDGRVVNFGSTQDAREAGIETVYQNLAVAPALDIASNLFLAREIRRPGILGSVFRMVDRPAMRKQSKAFIDDLGITTLQNIDQAVETLSGGQRQIVAVARAGAFGSKVVILDEPTAALGVRETGHVLKLVRDLRDKGMAVILISHNMPNVFETADRIHIQRLGGLAGVITPKSHSMEDAVAIMTGAKTLEPDEQTLR
ncbi:sugar ABC transporter ATP-binding protein [Microlunatus elymi]|uniref:Sugar ABC transporter ATP-binding protein n=1 Tax=Microlunatus elymi TaxID=2596828 RepID=A0A516Q221_9ACTN|nr:ATP-binding cassette domain-containing protein [Microlunatus elymi]QDP97261.1 sugar ABC transporter ATP-binding protein [Microlunatus elymi]